MYIGGDVILKALLILTFAATFIGNADSRGFRGGGFRSSRFRTTRSYRRPSSPTRRIGSTARFPRGWQVAAAGGMIFGYAMYQNRRSYRRHPNREPQICSNLYDYARTNGTHYQYFICPLADQPDSHRHCCGQTNRQHCCSYWSKPWNIVGTVVGILVLIGVIGACAYCCCCRKGANNETYAGRIISSRRGKRPSNPPMGQQMSYQSPAPAYTDTHSYQAPQSGPYPQQPDAYSTQAHPYPPQPYPDYKAPDPGYQPGEGNMSYHVAPGSTPYPAWQQPPPMDGSAGYPPYPMGQSTQPPYPAAAPPPYPH